MHIPDKKKTWLFMKKKSEIYIYCLSLANFLYHDYVERFKKGVKDYLFK